MLNDQEIHAITIAAGCDDGASATRIVRGVEAAVLAKLRDALKDDLDRSSSHGAPHGKRLPKTKNTPAHCVAMLAVRFPMLAKEMQT